jgi:hypothetical protein
MRFAIVIINYRTPDLVIDCLHSLKTEVQIGRDSVVIVDNASGDGSIEKITQAVTANDWTDWIQIVASPVNGGFSAGNNLGIKAVEADAYLLLNSDTIVRPGAIATLLETMQANPESGLIGPRLEYLDGTPQISCFRYRSPVGELIASAGTGPITKLFKNHDVPIPVSDTPVEPEWISFACVLVRRAVIEQVGLMDEGYFMYFEDIDYCRLARNAGWQILYCPQARVVHLRGGSSSTKSAIAARKRPRPFVYASRSRYFTKFYGPFGLPFANLCWLAGRSVSLTRELLGSRKTHICEHTARDIWMNWSNPMKQPLLPGTENS